MRYFHCKGKKRETEEGPADWGKKKHTRPVMQKHRFNVRLGSVISSGERKKLVWTRRKMETENGRGGNRVSSSGLRMPLRLLTEHTVELLKGQSLVEITGPGPTWVFLGVTSLRGRYPLLRQLLPPL